MPEEQNTTVHITRNDRVKSTDVSVSPYSGKTRILCSLLALCVCYYNECEWAAKTRVIKSLLCYNLKKIFSLLLPLLVVAEIPTGLQYTAFRILFLVFFLAFSFVFISLFLFCCNEPKLGSKYRKKINGYYRFDLWDLNWFYGRLVRFFSALHGVWAIIFIVWMFAWFFVGFFFFIFSVSKFFDKRSKSWSFFVRNTFIVCVFRALWHDVLANSFRAFLSIHTYTST